jgi:nicotinamide-nucleotide amidase
MKADDIDLELLAQRVGRHLARSKRSIATAESCTGGFIAKVLTDIPGSSGWVTEGFVTYSNNAKLHTLRVPPAVLARFGAVSEATARAMARGALTISRASIAVAVTGIAGPGGAVPGKPVGTVWFGWASRHGKRIEITTLMKTFRGDRDAVRRKTVCVALQGILRR